MNLLSNGLRGWKRSWKGDLRASLSVAFISVPLGLGIGLASGVPPLAAVIPCIIGGLLITWFSGGNIIVHSTPKMLIGVTAAAVLTLGGDDMLLGYRLFLAAVVFAGAIQFLLGMLKLGIIGDLIPATVIKSLLAAVGVIIIVKQVPVLLGVDIHPKNIIDLVASTPELIHNLNPIIAFIGILSTVIMFLHPKIDFPVIKAIPAAVWVVIVAEIYSHVIGFEEGASFNPFGILCIVNKSFLVSLPNEISQAIVAPDFSLWNTSVFWNIVVAIVVISSIEGILSAKAIDRLDPLKRKSNINKELSAIGVGTSISGLLGGLPLIPAIVVSSVAINHNAKSQLVNVFQALMILVLVVMLGSQLKLIPLAALAGILLHTGYKLLNPKEIVATSKIGIDQVLIFFVTLIVTLTTDLIIGISSGILLTILIHVIRLGSITKLFTILFRPNVVAYEEEDNNYLVSVKGYSNFLNYPRLKKALDLIPADAAINVDLSLAEFIDHTVMEHLTEYEENHIRRGGQFEILGMDNHHASTDHPLSVRFKGIKLKRDVRSITLTSRQQKLQNLANELEWGFDLTVRRFVTNFEMYHLFRFKTVDRVYNKLIGATDTASITIQDVDFHEGALQTKVAYQTTVAILKLNTPIPLFTIEKEHIFDKIAALAGYDDIDFKDFKKFSKSFRLKGENEASVRAFFSPKLLSFLESDLPFRLESAGNSILIVGKERPMSEAEIRQLTTFSIALAKIICNQES